MTTNPTRCEIIDWRITSLCDNSCSFCYASEKLESLDWNRKLSIVEKIISSGCKTVCISGGEPLLDPDTISIIEKLFQNNITIYLSTNGSRYMMYREKLEPMLSKLSLSLDGFDSDSQSVNGRSSESFENVIEILDYYSKKPHKFTIKIGTLLSKKNMNISHFEKMFELLSKYEIDLWKVYEFIPEGRGLNNLEQFQLPIKEKKVFLQSFYQLQSRIQESQCFECALITREMRDAAYFIIRPDGSVIIPFDSGKGVNEEVIGNLVSDPIGDVLKTWNVKIDSIKYSTNIDSRNLKRIRPCASVDETDKKILFLLDKNPLQEDDEILEALEEQFNISVGEIVFQSRIDKLFGSHALYRIMPVVNVANFGLSVFLLNLYFKYSYYMDAERIGNTLACKPYIAWVVQCKEYNSNDDFMIFRISIFAKDIPALEEYMQELRDAYGELLDSMDCDMVPEKYILDQTYLLEKYGEKLSAPASSNSHIKLGTTKELLTDDEFKVISAMSNIDRLSIKNISCITQFDNDKIRGIIEGLLRKQIINKFDVVLDANVIGCYVYLILFKFKNKTARKRFTEYITTIPNVTHINTLINGTWDMDIEIRVNQISTWAEIWKDIDVKFGNDLKSKKLIRIEREYNFKFLIGVTIDAMRDAVITSEEKVEKTNAVVEPQSRKARKSLKDRLQRK